MYLGENTPTLENRILDFDTQAKKILALVEARLNSGHRDAALQYLTFKFKTLYEQGVANGKSYERDGVFPY